MSSLYYRGETLGTACPLGSASSSSQKQDIGIDWKQKTRHFFKYLWYAKAILNLSFQDYRFQHANLSMYC